MAIDKAIDSVKLESDLTSIADAIREKGGTGDELAFPAGFVSAIEAISAGGGNVIYKAGSFTPEESVQLSSTLSTATYAIEHNLGHKPSFFILGKFNASYGLALDVFMYRREFLGDDGTGAGIFMISYTSSSGAGSNNRYVNHFGVAAAQNEYVTENVMPIIGPSSYEVNLVPLEYYWFAFAIVENT